jgi:hypothetical protein
VEEHIRLRLLAFELPSPPAAAAAGAAQHSLRRDYAVGDEVPLGAASCFVRALLHQLVQELLKSEPEFPVLSEGQGQRLIHHPAAQLVDPKPKLS